MNLFAALTTRLNIGQRFLASVCLFSLPLSVLFYFNLDQLNEKISFARGELAGNQMQRPAILLVNVLTEYQASLAAFRAATVSASLKEQVDNLFRQLETANVAYGKQIDFTPEALKKAGLENLSPFALEKSWQGMQAASQATAAESAQYEQLMSDLRSFISHAGDISNLTLDPEMDSYYLADVTSVTTAQTLNRIGTAEISLEASLGRGSLPSSELLKSSVLSSTLKESDFDRITGDLDTASKENAKVARGPSPTLKSNIDPALAQYKEDVQKLIDHLATIGNGKAVGGAEFHRIAAGASKATLNLWAKTLCELDTVLQMRIEGFSKYRLKLLLGTAIALALALVVLFANLRGVTGPLKVTVAHVEQVASGDLSKDLPAIFIERQDEIGVLARAIQGMSSRLRAMVSDIIADTSTLSSAITSLRDSSNRMTSEAQSASEKAHSVAAAAEEMTANVASLAAGMEETTTNLSHVASATTEMTSTVGEIAQNSEKARRISEEAKLQAEKVITQIGQMSDSAQEIGKVTETIAEISSQTNLLALNATIEAARAGAAGKGFAVVANEIKELAQQAAAATEDIKSRIGAVQNSTSTGVSEIAKVSQVIHEISDVVSSIAAAIEEQAVATKTISSNISEASLGVNDANERVAQSSGVSREISRDIGTVDLATIEMQNGSRLVWNSTEELARVAKALTSTVGNFKV